MKKLITLLILFVGMVSTVSAKTATVYVKASSAPRIYVWNTGDGGTTTSWGTDGGDLPVMTATNLYGVKVYKYDVTYSSSEFNYLFKYVGGNQSADCTASSDTYVTYDGGNKTTPSSYGYTINKVELRGSFNSWASGYEMNLAAGVYSSTIDLSESLSDGTFKVVITNEAGDIAWLGYHTSSPTITDAGSLLSSDKEDNFVVANSNKTYKTYNINVTLNPTTWSLTFAGNSTRGSQTYNLTLNNEAGWGAVKVYTFNPDLYQSGAWAEADDMTNTSGSTWTYTKTFYEPYPQSVIFKDAGSKQTADLKLINNHTYTNQGVEKYYVVGNISAFGNFNPDETTALMTATKDGESRDIHTYTIENLALSGNVEYKIIKRLYEEQTAFDWYPSGNKVITISEDGKYTLTIQFNDYWGDKSLETVTSCDAALTAVHATIGGAGCATFSSTHDLDFTGVKDLNAYTATSAGGGFVHMEPVSGKVPANTGLFLSGASKYIPVTTDADAVGTNLLLPTTGGDIYNSSLHQYVLANQSGLGFYKVAGSLSPDAGKAYLETAEAIGSDHLARVAIIFEDETTGIETVKASQKTNGEFFNLAGQRVAQPTKGLYIVNGKKVIMK